jgi:outer membrane protein TolC
MFKRFGLIFFFFVCSVSLLFSQSQARTLDYYVNTGISNNPSFKDFQNQQAALSYDSLLVRVSRKPQINANGLVLTAPRINGYGYDEAITNGNTFSAVVSFSQDLLVGKTNRNQYANIHIQNQSLQNNSHLTARELKRDITFQYILGWAAGKEVIFNNEVFVLLQEQSEIVKQLATQGLYNHADYLTMQIEIQTQQINIRQLRIEYLQNLYDLNRLCGITDTANYSLPEPVFANLIVQKPQQLPFFEQFRIDSLKTVNELEMTKLKYIPKLSWYADVGINNTDPLLIYKNFGFSAGLNFSVPLNSSRQKKLELAKISLAEDTRSAYKNFFDQQFNMQVYQIRQQISQYDSLIAVSEQQIKMYNELIDNDRLLINKGSISILDFITVLRNYMGSRNIISGLKTKRMLLINELNYWSGI